MHNVLRIMIFAAIICVFYELHQANNKRDIIVENLETIALNTGTTNQLVAQQRPNKD